MFFLTNPSRAKIRSKKFPLKANRALTKPSRAKIRSKKFPLKCRVQESVTYKNMTYFDDDELMLNVLRCHLTY